MRYSLILLSLLIISCVSCEDPASLEAIAGIEGQIDFEGTKPDSIRGVALVVLLPEALTDQENLGKYLIGYSDPMSQAGGYFVELKPGAYMGVLVGLLVDPGLFAVNVDTYLSSGELPIVQLSDGANAFLIREKEIHERDWIASFSQ